MKRKSLVITLLIALIIGILTTSASALSFTATMTPSSTTVPESTEFTIVIKVSNLDVGTNGINSLSGYLKYDTKVFEEISDSSLEGLNGWEPEYNSDNGKLTLVKSKFVKEEQEVFQITFKTKSGVSSQSGAISFSNIVASNSESDISASDISTTITVGTNSNIINGISYNNNTQLILPSTVNPTNTNTNNSGVTSITPTVNGTQNNNTDTNTNTQTNETSDEDMPYTGVEDVALRAIFVVLVISAISYFKYESMKDVK
jgi:hypothetical protein